MGAITDMTHLLVRTAFTLLIVMVLLRSLLQLSRADFYNPITQLLVKATDPLFLPVQRLLGGWLGAIVAILALQMLATTSLIWLVDLPLPNILWLMGWAMVGTIGLVINIYLFAIIIVIVLSWVAPASYHPAVMVLHQLTEPIMAPFRKIVPPLGGLDLSPLLIFLMIHGLQIVLRYIAIQIGVIPVFVIGI